MAQRPARGRGRSFKSLTGRGECKRNRKREGVFKEFTYVYLSFLYYYYYFFYFVLCFTFLFREVGFKWRSPTAVFRGKDVELPCLLLIANTGRRGNPFGIFHGRGRVIVSPSLILEA